MVYSLDDVIDFGKYKNKTIREIIDDDPDYIEWALDETDNFGFDLDLEAYYYYQDIHDT